MGFGGSIGEIAAGFKADIVFLDLGHINYVPCHDVISQIVFTENGAAVDSVMIGGVMVLDHGLLTTIDEKKLRRDASAAAERLFAANSPTRSFAKELQPFVGDFCHASRLRALSRSSLGIEAGGVSFCICRFRLTATASPDHS